MAGNVKKLKFSEGVTVTAAVQNFIEASGFSVFASDAAFETAKGSAGEEGDSYYNSANNSIRSHNGSEWEEVVSKIPVYANEAAFDTSNGTAAQGDVYFDSTFRKLRSYDGTQWKNVGSGVGSISYIKVYRANDDGLTDWSVKSIDDVLPDFTGADTLTATFTDTSSGDALFSTDNADKVYNLAAASGSQYDAVGVDIDIPKVARGKDIGLSFYYRTKETTGSTADNSWMVWVFDKSNGAQTTAVSTGAQSAGTSIEVASSTGMAVGDKIWVGETGGTTQVTEAYITAIADSTHVTISEAVTLTAGDRFTTGILTDVLTTLNAADSDTNEIGEKFQVTFLPEETTAQVTVMLQQLTSETDSFIYWDGLVLDSDPFAKVSTQGISESYIASDAAIYASNNTALPYFQTVTLNTISKYGTITNDSSDGFYFTASQKCRVNMNVRIAYTSSGAIGITKNTSASDLDTTIYSVTEANVVAASRVEGTSSGECSFSGVLQAGDIIYAHAETGKTINTNANRQGVTLLVEPQVNEAVIVESTDSVFTEWASYTPAITGFGTVSSAGAKWRRVGDTMEVEGSFISGTSTATDAQIDLPIGYFINTAKLSGDGSMGVLGHSYRIDATSNYANGSSHLHVIFSDLSDTGSVFISKQASSDGSMDKSNGSGLAAASDGLAFSFKVPIAGWDANPKPLLAFPTVSYGQEPEHYSINGVAGAASGFSNLMYFSTVNDSLNTISNLGTVNNDGTNGWSLTISQRCLICIGMAQSDSGSRSWVAGLNLTSGEKATAPSTNYSTSPNKLLAGYVDPSASTDTAYSLPGFRVLEPGDEITLNFESGFYSGTNIFEPQLRFALLPIQGVTNQAAIISQPVALIKDIKSDGTSSGTFTQDAWQTRTLNTLSGDIGAVGVSLSSNQFTLPAGKFLIEWSAPAYDVGSHITSLYNTTDSLRTEMGTTEYCSTANDVANRSFGEAVVTLNKSTTFEIQHWCDTTKATIGFGGGAGLSTTDEVFAMVKITRKK